MQKLINLSINGNNVSVSPGSTILDAAKKIGIVIPTLCHDERVKVYGACGLCVVEVAGIPKLLRACSTQVADGMEILTNTEKVVSSRKCALELLLSDHAGDCRPPCVLACPAETDCQGYVGLIANGEYYESVKLIMKKLPLPASIGRVCPHPCETACRRQLVEEPIAIAHLKSFVGDIALKEGKGYKPDIAPDTGKQVAIIGGGPGGLTAAYFLRTMGHSVKVYDMMPKMGGMLLYGIPAYRLPEYVLESEIENIKALGGIEFFNEINVGNDISLDDLRKQNDAVVVAIGAWVSSRMKVKGEELDGVIGGIDFLREVVLDEPPSIGDKVAVCGGGNTAMDACRTALRLGAKEVYVIYRRTRDEMPADDFEIEEASEEGVIFKYLTNPEEFYGVNGKLTGVKLQLMELGEPDAGGRRRPVPIEGVYEEIELDTVIMAIGQQVNTSGFEDLERTKWNTIIADEHTYRTSLEGVFAVGDATNDGADIAISAIGEAHRASSVIDSYLKGNMVPIAKPYLVRSEVTAEDFRHEKKKNRSVIRVHKPEIRKHTFYEVVFGYAEEDAVREAARCLECGCNDYFECKLIWQSNNYGVKPEVYEGKKRETHKETAHPYIEQNAEKCILCGLCVRVCDEMVGVTALGLVDRGFETVVSPEFRVALADTDCIACGQCVTLCPTGALREKSMQVKSVPVAEKSTVSTCPACAAACEIDIRTIGNTVVRTLPYGEFGILCAQGRFGHGVVHDPRRITRPLIKSEGKYIEAAYEEAYSYFSKIVNKAVSAHGAESVALMVADNITTQEAYIAKRLATEAIKTTNISLYRQSKKTVIDSLNLKEKSKEIFENLFGEAFNDGINYYGINQMLGYNKKARLKNIRLAIVIGDYLPDNLPKLQHLVHIGLGTELDDRKVDLFLPIPAYPEKDGSFHVSSKRNVFLKNALEKPNCQNSLITLNRLAKAIDETFETLESVEEINKALLIKT